MKMKTLITVLSGFLFIVFLVFSLKAPNHTALNFLTSFGMGLTVPVFISGLVTMVKKRDAKKMWPDV
jgi:energy-coupling factor transporter transmembrane protein EcfT